MIPSQYFMITGIACAVSIAVLYNIFPQYVRCSIADRIHSKSNYFMIVRLGILDFYDKIL